MASTVIPFGPQHPVLPEPLHFKLKIEEETVVDAIPAVGFVHRGLEGLVSKKDFIQMTQVVERVCGICSAMHGMCYCMGIEELMGIEVPKKASFLRIVWTELHRIHSHLLWFGLYADSFGFESLFMEFWKIREKIMDINEATAGSRIIISVNVIGGVKRDISPEHRQWILSTLDEVEERLKRLEKVIYEDFTIRKRTVGIGILSKEKAYELGASGPMARGSGLDIDARSLGYGCFSELDWEPIVEYGGDCYSRAKVRFREMLQSIGLIRQAFQKMPRDEEICVKFNGCPEGEVISRVEQPRGECLYYIKGNGTKNLERCRIRTPSFANFPPIMSMLIGCRLADVPVIILSMDPCISCTER